MMMTTTRRNALTLIAGTALTATLGQRMATAETYPTRPVQVIVPFAGQTGRVEWCRACTPCMCRTSAVTSAASPM